MRPTVNALRAYSVAIITSTGGVISRDAGCDLAAAIDKAIGRRADFPDAQEVRLICSAEGVIASF